jgi:cytochrome bd-type quinol oxidase subunit 1
MTGIVLSMKIMSYWSPFSLTASIASTPLMAISHAIFLLISSILSIFLFERVSVWKQEVFLWVEEKATRDKS